MRYRTRHSPAATNPAECELSTPAAKRDGTANCLLLRPSRFSLPVYLFFSLLVTISTPSSRGRPGSRSVSVECLVGYTRQGNGVIARLIMSEYSDADRESFIDITPRKFFSPTAGGAGERERYRKRRRKVPGRHGMNATPPEDERGGPGQR